MSESQNDASTSERSTKNAGVKVDPAYVKTFIENIFTSDMHAARVLSLSNGVVGVLHAAALAIHASGQAYAKVANLKPKNGVKQVDRLLSKAGFDMSVVIKPWVRFVVGVRKEIVVALDWTDFEKDDHTTLCAYWVPANGRATMLRKVAVTDDRSAKIPAVVVVRAPKMKEAWCLATTLSTRKASEVVKLYGKRFSIEETFRDEKNLHFGMGLSATHIRDAARRDRLLLLAAIAHALLTLLGAASEEAGLDKYLKVNTVKRRTHSLYRQGLYWYDCIPTMREDWLRPLMVAFDRIVREQAVFHEVLGII